MFYVLFVFVPEVSPDVRRIKPFRPVG